MYLDEAAAAIKKYVPAERLPEGADDELWLTYAVLLRAKGGDVTESDVHDAWAAWMSLKDRGHKALQPYGALPSEVQAQDRVYATAIRRAADDLRRTKPSRPSFAEVLFPSGPPLGAAAATSTLELYRIMVASSESLVARRQGVNTFFLTINGVLLTASGLVIQSSGGASISGWGVFVLATAGGLLCGAWHSLIRSFGQLNAGKFKVINSLERHLPAAIYSAEWEALERGEDPAVYRSFTSREIWVPNSLLLLYVLAALTALLVATGIVSV